MLTLSCFMIQAELAALNTQLTEMRAAKEKEEHASNAVVSKLQQQIADFKNQVEENSKALTKADSQAQVSPCSL